MTKFLVLFLIFLNIENAFSLALPSRSEKYLKFGMDKDNGEKRDINLNLNSNYFTIEKRLRTMIFYKNGLFLDYKQNIIHTFKYYIYANTEVEQERFVMDEYGNIFLNIDKKDIKHSYFLAGKPVASAGWLKIRYGKLEDVFINSGHYRPNLIQQLQIIIELLKRGIEKFNFILVWSSFLGEHFLEIKQTDLSKYLKIYYAS